MKQLEKEMVGVLEKLKSDHGATHVKVAMEAEGILLGEILRTKIITMAAGIGLSIKIGGCEAVRERIVLAGKEHGFKYITLDLAGYRTGSHNEVLQADGSLRVIGQ